MPDTFKTRDLLIVRTFLLQHVEPSARPIWPRAWDVFKNRASRHAFGNELLLLLSSPSLQADEEMRKKIGLLAAALKSLPPNLGGGRIAPPPGVHLRVFADAVFSTKTRQLILEPTLRDLYDEYCEALNEGRPWKARWARVRGYGSFWSAVIAQLPVSLLKKLLDIWKAVS